MSKQTTFLNQLSSAKKVCGGLYLFQSFLSQQEADEALAVLNSENFPWNLKPKLFGSSLPQHAYHHHRSSKSEKLEAAVGTSIGLAKLEDICKRLERTFDVKITDVYCNRFQDPSHRIEWHKDTYGGHIFVLSLGATRKVQFRNNKTREISEMEPSSGDVYFMPLALNDTHKHQVCAAQEADDADTRLSFVFFFEPPAYAKDYRITTRDRIKGAWESFWE